MSNVRKEFELYAPMRVWLQTYLEDKYKRGNIVVVDAHAWTLDKVLETQGVISGYPHIVGLDIEIDVLSRLLY